MKNKKALVIIPTYNESENIAQIVPEILQQDKIFEVLVVDDNSPDGTADIVKDMKNNNGRIHLIEREGKLGLGSAYIRGFKYALANNYDFIFEMDADFSHNPKDLTSFLVAIKEADLVIGSRYCKGINVVNWPFKRLLLSFFAAKYVRLITGMPINDPTGGFKCFRRKILEEIDLDKIMSDGYSFQIEMNYKAWKKGFKIVEIPIVFVERRSGSSKMSKAIVREAIFVVWKLRFFPKLWQKLSSKRG
ncbi:MAG: polyprenol monophosphomannose synthase [Candidatus Cloacimonetes bacterium]|nr:polyprenol monophosphomannose synthase [Candidatus Cloacimonadota bacterium]